MINLCLFFNHFLIVFSFISSVAYSKTVTCYVVNMYLSLIQEEKREEGNGLPKVLRSSRAAGRSYWAALLLGLDERGNVGANLLRLGLDCGHEFAQ